MGKGYFYPSIALGVENDDNLFQDEGGPVEATWFTIGPDLQWRFPLAQSAVSLGYRPSWKQYEREIVPDTLNHQLEFGARLEFRNQAVQQIDLEVEQGISELTAFTGGEPTFSGDEYLRYQGRITHRHPVTRRQLLDVRLFGGQFEFDEPERAAFFNFSDYGAGLGWARLLSDALEYRVEFRLSDNQQDRPDFSFTQSGTGESVSISSFQEEQFIEGLIWSGVEGAIGEHVALSLFYGYGRLVFNESAEQDYEGPVLDAEMGFQLGRSWELKARLGRTALQSSFNVANFFVDERAAVDVVWQSPRRLRFSLGAARQTNTYRDPVVTNLDGDPGTGTDAAGNEIRPVPEANFVAGVLRLDKIDTVRARLEFILRPDRLRIFLEGTQEQRSSNIAFFDFDRTVVSLGLRFGWLPPATGGI